ncbi:uncharacterized protein LOC121635494 isoform X1 [Melanotaenia boesemani]|uniref:uncharacterized protein LOC121635494 isoform X1 n=1 Tax=Melanotaenia boesemani TaxID=1250792 RepID=UPI001C059173|nr:uncharacterized protein LOC121635494 isoform X1 [Melanotaenia boesemani]
MRPCRARLLLAGWLVFILFVKFAASEKKVYGRLGGQVDLKPEVVPAADTSIIWKEGENLAMKWERQEIRAYRHYEERGRLNISTGMMTITGLIPTDSGLYTPEINNKVDTPILLEVISDVPVPTLKSCDSTVSVCTLVCEGDTTGAGPVSYTWKADNKEVPEVSGNEYIIKKEISNIKEFSCELNNEFSRQSSNPIPNPFATPESKLNIFKGVTVFICLLLPVLLLVIFHKCKTGVCFYEKTSMPWEANFWKRNERPRERIAESNGTTRAQPRDQTEEETPMK